ncbi:MAG: hypothetical protein DRH12_11875 [Deltaproteobacteria bacterium]|nr:MAG: hypothetical protein DRH12_11875 [Deltaproteobacteria bacterium]
MDNGQERELTLIITMKVSGGVYKGVGIKKESTALSNEMASLFMLEKAKDIVKVLHAPRIQPAKQHGIINFLRKKK